MSNAKTSTAKNTKAFFSGRKGKIVLRSDSVKVPEWDDRTIYLKEPSAGEMNENSKGLGDDKDGNFSMLYLCMVEKDGNRVFESAEECKEYLEPEGASIVGLLVSKSAPLLGINIEEALKNLKETQAGSPSSD